MSPDTEKVLDATQLADALIDLPGWELKGKQIVKTYTFKTFQEAMDFANRVAQAAEQQNHHPSIHIDHVKVKILSWTHKFNAVTKLDIRLAEEIDKVFESV